ncbi:hypothetical protein PR048_026305 [Dryococelus australis]|uniref:Uncharacterized protein n=1 Tax=Dryococelus australis TaxID=614101 RepID=A0ABQ9GL14_9NEOP|nr:hypothetical protein PR048_026305 [Dryococelus australis]
MPTSCDTVGSCAGAAALGCGRFWVRIPGLESRGGWSDVSTEQRRKARAGETGCPGENPPTNGIDRHDFDMRKYGSDPSTRARTTGRGKKNTQLTRTTTDGSNPLQTYQRCFPDSWDFSRKTANPETGIRDQRHRSDDGVLLQPCSSPDGSHNVQRLARHYSLEQRARLPWTLEVIREPTVGMSGQPKRKRSARDIDFATRPCCSIAPENNAGFTNEKTSTGCSRPNVACKISYTQNTSVQAASSNLSQRLFRGTERGAAMANHWPRIRGGHGFDSRSGHPDFRFPCFPEIAPKLMLGWVPNKGYGPLLPQSLFPCATCTVSNDLAVDETLSPITYLPPPWCRELLTVRSFVPVRTAVKGRSSYFTTTSSELVDQCVILPPPPLPLTHPHPTIRNRNSPVHRRLARDLNSQLLDEFTMAPTEAMAAQSQSVPSARLLASHLGEPGSVLRFSQVGIVLDYAAACSKSTNRTHDNKSLLLCAGNLDNTTILTKRTPVVQ